VWFCKDGAFRRERRRGKAQRNRRHYRHWRQNHCESAGHALATIAGILGRNGFSSGAGTLGAQLWPTRASNRPDWLASEEEAADDYKSAFHRKSLGQFRCGLVYAVRCDGL
jgi:hypothetical protein